MKEYKYLLFDMDGTLIDSKNGIIDSVLCALKSVGIEENDRKSLDCFIGPPLHDSLMKKYGLNLEDATKIVGIYRKLYPETGMLNVELYPQVKETLESLKSKGYKLYVATSKPTAFTQKILESKGLTFLFEGIVGSNLDNTRNKKCEVIDFIINEYGITDISKVLMIGDKSHDIIGARLCGVDAVGVLYGYGTQKELENENPKAIISELKDLVAFLMGEQE